MQKLFDDFVALLRIFALQESVDFSTILWNYGKHFSDTGGSMSHKFEPKWHIPV